MYIPSVIDGDASGVVPPKDGRLIAAVNESRLMIGPLN